MSGIFELWHVGGFLAIAAGGLTMSRLRSSKADEMKFGCNDSMYTRFFNKLGGLVKMSVLPKPEISEWERELVASRPDLVMHPRVSKLVQNCADGIILLDLPRIYSPNKPLLKDSIPEGSDLTEQDVFCVWHFGTNAVGHTGIVHGGAIAMALDESFGHAFISLGKGPGFTAFLNTNYRKPLPAGGPVLITVSVESVSGRKVFLAAKVTDGADRGAVYADARALFVVAGAAPRAAPAVAAAVAAAGGGGGEPVPAS